MARFKQIPMVALRGLTVFPQMIIHFDVARSFSKSALDEALLDDQLIFLVTQKDVEVDIPAPEDIYSLGTVAVIKQVLKLPGDITRVLVEGLYRANIREYVAVRPHFVVKISKSKSIMPSEEQMIEVDALMHMCKREFGEFVRLSDRMSPDSMDSVGSINDPERFADVLASHVVEDTADKQALLETDEILLRLEKLFQILLVENQRLNVEKKISLRVKKQIDDSQREYYLREQIKAIHTELGESDSDVEELSEQVRNSDMPPEAKEKALKELDRMSRMNSAMPELSVLRNYIEWLLDVPWTEKTEDNLDLDNALQILNEDHYGLENVKDRILEFLAVCQLKKDIKGTILCFVGPPGVGKTSIARSVARAIGRKFVRMSLGGVRDEAEIRGHRRTYIGAIPGRIISGMKQAGTVNPVFLFDELDKMGNDYRGDPASAMLEVLDSEQNNTFTDHYMEVPYDLSQVLFIATANTVDTIPRPLLDRMEVIQVSSYTELEKMEIAKRHLLGKQEQANGLAAGTVVIDDEMMLEIINAYTREAGVRALERELGKICRRSARLVVKENKKKVKITKTRLREFLGAPKYLRELLTQTPTVGTACGLAWTQAGGETLSIDVALMPGKGELVLTGQLGDVMKESAKAGLSMILSHAEELGIDTDELKKKDIHIHIPEGATPKDGPSAGITMFTAMVSAITGRPVRGDVAMTGEITLRGRVLPIGGLKEKAIAAHRAGIATVIIPKENTKDIEQIPQSVRESLKIIPVSEAESVLKVAFAPQKK